MNKLIPITAAVLCSLFVSCAMSDVRSIPPPRFIADTAPVEMGEFEVYSTQLFATTLRKHKFTLVYHPRTDELLVHYRDGTRRGRFYLTSEARDLFINSVPKYEELYQKRELVEKSRTNDVFGRFPVKLEWGGPSSYEARGTSSLKMGYLFRDQAPWLCLTVDKATNDLYSPSTGLSIRDSVPKTFYFNRRMASEFAELLNHDTLLSMVDSGSRDGLPIIQEDKDAF